MTQGVVRAGSRHSISASRLCNAFDRKIPLGSFEPVTTFEVVDAKLNRKISKAILTAEHAYMSCFS